MRNEMMDCKNFDELYWLHAYGEGLPGGEEGFLKHLESCARCQARQAELDRLRGVLDMRPVPVPKPELLAEARGRLRARLQRARGRSRVAALNDWLRRNVWAEGAPRWQLAAALGGLVFGLIIGRIFYFAPVQTVIESPGIILEPAALERQFIAENVIKDGSQITDLRVKPLQKEDGIVRVSFRAARDYEIEGSPEDEPIRELLTWAVKNENNSGVRLTSVEELARASRLSAQARQALAYALVNDQNDGVRLRALEALGRAPLDQLSEQAILQALLEDPNPAVRIQAINALLVKGVRERPDAFLLRAAESDSNDYVRLKARRAIQQSTADYTVFDRNR